jgi:hypothetical protein
VEVREAMKNDNLNIPILPRNPKQVLDYVRKHPGNYYLVTAKWGPWGDYQNHPEFKLVGEFGKKEKTKAKIYHVIPTSRSEPL